MLPSRVEPEDGWLRLHGAKGLLLAALAIVLFVLYAAAIYEVFVRDHPGANDFYIPWRAVRELVIEGRNPYSPEVTRDIQQVLFGGPRPPGTHQFAFAYPLTVLPLLAPLAPLPYDWAEAVWLTLSLWALLGGLFLLLRALGWSPQPLALAGLAVWTILFYPAARALILGQIAAIVFFLVALSIFLLHRGHPAWAGAALAGATIKPQMAVLLLPVLLLWTVDRRQRAALRTFVLTLGGMIVFPMLWLPTWPADFVHAVMDYADYVPVGSPVEIAVSHLPFSQALAIALDIMLIVLLAHQWWRGRKRDEPSLLWWVASLAIVVGLLVVPRGGTTNQVLLVIPCVLLVWWYAQRRGGPMAAIILMALLIIVPWLLFVATVQGDTEQDTMFVPLPFAVLLLLLLFRPGKQPCVQ